MNASTLNPKADPAADEQADANMTALGALYRLRYAVKNHGQREIIAAADAVAIAIYHLEHTNLVETDVILDTLRVITNTVGDGIYQQERPLLLEVVGAIERQIELIAERESE